MGWLWGGSLWGMEVFRLWSIILQLFGRIETCTYYSLSRSGQLISDFPLDKIPLIISFSFISPFVLQRRGRHGQETSPTPPKPTGATKKAIFTRAFTLSTPSLPPTMSSQPLLQSAPGTSSPTLTPNPLHSQLTPSPLPRKTHRPPHTCRTQSLLRQRTDLPRLPQLHRPARRPRHRAPKLRRQHRSDLSGLIYVGGDGDNDLCVVHVSLAGEEYTHEGAGRVR